MAAVVFLVGKELGSLAMGKLGSMAIERVNQEFWLLAGVQEEAKQLAPTLALIKAVVQDAEVKQTDSNVVKLWLETLKDIMYDADDLLDEWYTRIAISQLEFTEASSSSSAFSTKVFSLLTSNCSCFEPFFILLFGDNFLPIVVRYEIAHKIKDIRARLVKQSDEIKQLGLIPSQSLEVHSPSQPSTHHRRLTTSKDVDKIYGRDIDKDVIVRMLLGETGSSEQQEMVRVPVISIVGTGGFGKTTLAQLIYKQDTIMTAFDLRIWVCVSDPFNLERVVKEIIQQAKAKEKHAGESVSNVFGLEALLEHLCASVKDKRFLLVLDDVWSEDDRDWIPLKNSLEAGAPGSRILVTTRSVRVANSMGSTNPHRLGQLTDADCWLLFHNIAILGRSDEKTKKLESIGRELARKCEGVPLAVKTLASSMRFKKRIEEWSAVLESDTWRVLQQHKDGFLPSLMFSYLALTPSLKLCFLYCAGFPKDFRMKKDELVKQWMAQGFLESDGGDELEMIGAENFDILAMRSLFQDFQEDNGGSIVACSMHDLVHEFCRFLASGEVRHMTISDLNDLDNSSNEKKIRTLKFLVFRESIPFQVFNQFTCLRTLFMDNCNIQELPGEVVGGLLHLRYLDLSRNKDLRELPETVCNLLNLQTLKLEGCTSLCKMPEGIGKLRNLRHLEIEGTLLNYFPPSIGKLRNLRTLGKFVVSGMAGGCGIGELSNLNHLRGTLCLIGIRHVHNLDEAKRAKLHEKRNLNCLKFGMKFGRRDAFDAAEEGEIERMEDVFESLRPNVNLEELEINYYPGFKLPSWTVSPLSKVVTLEVNVCDYCQTLPGLGHLQFLETLRLHYFGSMKHIGAEFYGVGVATSFPKLKTLEFMRLDKLETWEIPFPNYEKVMPCLQSLAVKFCRMLIGLPSLGRLESLETIEILGSPLVKVGTELFGMSSGSIGNESNKNMTSSGGGDYVKKPTAVKHVSAHLLGNLDGESTTSASSSSVVLLPRLTCLKLLGLPKWEEEEHAMDNDASIMPCLRILSIELCRELKVVPHYMFSQSLRTLELRECPQLTGTQHCLPPLLEEISFYGDVGVLSTSLLPVISHRNNTTTYPNLKIVRIEKSPHFSLPEGLNQFTSLEELFISDCARLVLKLPEELPHLPMLQKLKIRRCPLITERSRRGEWISISTRPDPLRKLRRINKAETIISRLPSFDNKENDAEPTLLVTADQIYFHDIPNDIMDKLIEEGDVLYVAGGLIIEHPLVLPLVKEVVGTTDSVMGLPKALTEELIQHVL